MSSVPTSDSRTPPKHTVTTKTVTTTTVGAGHDDSDPAGASRQSSADEFARQAEQAQPGLLAEFWDFLLHNKKWWLIPIILVLLLATVLVLLGGSAAAPFIYPGI